MEYEQVWTYLVADILDTAADQAPYLRLLCGDAVPCGGPRVEPWFEAQPLSPRLGTPKVDHESNTEMDLVFGAVARRGQDGSGIAFDPAWPGSWACFVEAKFYSDCDCRITNDPFRNQLERDIESLLCFQGNGRFPERLFFTLLTPRRFKDRPRTRLYGYRMREYLENKELVIEDIRAFATPGRSNYGQVYPDVHERVGVLTLTWATFDEIVEAAFDLRPVDMLDPAGIPGLGDRLDGIAEALERQ
jgi:hypothetical protein